MNYESMPLDEFVRELRASMVGYDICMPGVKMARRAADELDRLHGALRAVVSHWDEFGPEHGFDECVNQARRALAPAGDKAC